MTADYLGISVPEVDDLDYLYYLRMRRDAWIHVLSGTEQGTEYLNEAWRLTRTEPDREASRSFAH